MNTNVNDASHNIQSTKSPPSAAKVSILANKSGFVIPRNKLSGSLVPVFRGGKKDGRQSINDDISKLVQRKTKWGLDLTQDATVRKGRVLAYQTRVDQITQQLSSQAMDWDTDQGTLSASTIENNTINVENIKVLELERREVIGELLKLNPNYKPPAGYKPVQKEERIPIPIKEHPGYNFLGMIFGPMSDTHKRLEKEIGAKVKVYGIREDTGQKVEIASADEKEMSNIYKEMYVQVLADTYEKLDSAVSLMELAVTPVSVKTTSESTPVSNNDNGVKASTDDNPPTMEGPGFQQSSPLPETSSSSSFTFPSVPQSHSFMRPIVTPFPRNHLPSPSPLPRFANPNPPFPPQPIMSVPRPPPHRPLGSSGDFAFQPHQPRPRPWPNPSGFRFDPHPPPNFVNNQLIHSAHSFPRSPPIIRPDLQVNHHMIRRQPPPPGPPPPPMRPTLFPNSGGPFPRNFNPAVPPMVNPGSPFPPRMFQHNNPPTPMVARPPNFPPPVNDFRPGMPAPSTTFGMQQSYDPFSPTSLS